MEFNEKLQELRKQKGLTQDEVATALFVSRTTVSKWESGRGYPNIDSLKAIANLFSVTIDQLLSGNELLTLAEEDNKRREKSVRDLVFGLLDCSVCLFWFLPLFGQKISGAVYEVSLPSLTTVSLYLKIAYVVFVIATVVLGVLTLALQNANHPFWTKRKNVLSLLLNVVGVGLFVISLQPYAAIFLFLCLTIKTAMLIKRS